MFKRPSKRYVIAKRIEYKNICLWGSSVIQQQQKRKKWKVFFLNCSKALTEKKKSRNLRSFNSPGTEAENSAAFSESLFI